MRENDETPEEKQPSHDDSMVVTGCTYILSVPKSELPLFHAGQALVAIVLVGASGVAVGIYFTLKVLLS